MKRPHAGRTSEFHQELRLAQDKVRVYVLARELHMDTKDLLDWCKKAGFDIKNQLSSLEPEQRDAVLELIRRGGSASTATTPRTPPTVPDQRVRILDQPRRG